MKASVALAVLLSACISLPVSGQSCKPPDCVILKGSQLTQSALVEALTPPPAQMRGYGSLKDGKAAAPRPKGAILLITFETNSTELTAASKQQLDTVGQGMNTSKLAEFSFVVEGHADPRGAPDWNQQLSEGRAEAVRQYLVENLKVDPGRLKTVGKGDREPYDSKNPAAAENRRVTFLTVVN